MSPNSKSLLSNVLLAFLLIGICIGASIRETRIQAQLNAVANLGRESIRDAIIDISMQARIITDLDGVIRWCSPAAAEVCGYEPSELIGLPSTVIIPERYQGAHDKGLDRFKKAPQVDPSRVIVTYCEIRRKDGAEIKCEIRVRAVKTVQFHSPQPESIPLSVKFDVLITPLDKIEITAMKDSKAFDTLVAKVNWSPRNGSK